MLSSIITETNKGEKKEEKKKEKKGILSIWRSRDPSVWYLFMKTFEPEGSVEEAQGRRKTIGRQQQSLAVHACKYLKGLPKAWIGRRHSSGVHVPNTSRRKHHDPEMGCYGVACWDLDVFLTASRTGFASSTNDNDWKLGKTSPWRHADASLQATRRTIMQEQEMGWDRETFPSRHV